MKLTTGCKVWLWFLLIGGVISAVVGFTVLPVSVSAGIITVILALLQVVGVAMMLFAQKTEGFYVLCAMSVLHFIYSIVSGAGLIASVIRLVLIPGITYLLISRRKK